MHRYLIVGDYHAEPSDLDDCRRLADFIVEKAKELKAIVIFTGDQYHTHSIIHAEVQLFWFELYARLQKEAFGSISLIGNHDKPGSASSKASAMLAHTTQTQVIREPTQIGPLLFVPYYDDKDEFVKACNASSAPTIICHQTFDGSKYDNGFYAKDAIDPNLISQKVVVSGHIHTPQEFDKVWYVGAPRWRTLSDANTDRHIWYVEFNGNTGEILERKSFATDTVCRKICTFEDREERWTDSDGEVWAPPYLNPKHEWNVDIYGSAAYIESRLGIYHIMGCRIRTFRTDLEQASVRESDGLTVAYEKWINDFKPRFGTSTDKLREMVKTRNGNQ
jgi:hypothetical protein